VMTRNTETIYPYVNAYFDHEMKSLSIGMGITAMEARQSDGLSANFYRFHLFKYT